jgi:16S rRNA (uracil1498-N3)-methyltransferase
MQQYFHDATLRLGDRIRLDEETEHHQRKVLRSQTGQLFRIVDREGRVFIASLDLKEQAAYADLIEFRDENAEMTVKVTVIQSLIKGDKWDVFLQKATECGVFRIVPFISSRNVVKYDAKTDGKKLERWRKIVREAAEQSRRNLVPEVCDVIDATRLKDYLSEQNLVAYELESGGNAQLKDVETLRSNVSILIGSEGGFTSQEIEKFRRLGFEPVGLGKRILRAETAAIVALTLIESKT